MSQDHSSLRTTAPPPPPAPAPTGETMRTSVFLPPNLAALEQGPPIPSALNAPPTAFTLMRAFQRRWPLAIGAGLVMAALSAAAVMVIFPAKYVAFYVAKINAAGGGNVVVRDVREDPDFTVFKLTQAALAKSRPVVQRALESDVSGKYIKDLGIVRNSPDASLWLQGAVKADFIKAPEIMTVTLSGDQPQELTTLVNALGKALVDENRVIAERKHQTLIEDAKNQAQVIQKEIEKNRRIYNQRNPNGGNKKNLDNLEAELREARSMLRLKESELTAARSNLDQMEKRIANPDVVPDHFIDDALLKDPNATQVVTDVQIAGKEYSAALRILMDPGHPQMQGYATRKAQADRNYDAYRRRVLPDIAKKYREVVGAELNRERQKLQDAVVGLDHVVALQQATVERLENELRTMRGPNTNTPELVALLNEIETAEKALDVISQQIHFLRINPPQNRVSILQDAIEPGDRDTSRQYKIAGAASIGMFLLTVLGVSFLEFRSRKITSSDEVKRGLGLTVLGTVPTLPEKARSPIAQTKLDPYWQNQIMESVDTIRTMLLHNARSTNTRVIMVTSAVGGEGKTSLASQLAASLARAWKKTLLIDGDLRNPATHRLFDVPQEPGLSEVLRGELPATEAVRSTPLSRLWVLPAGHWDNHAVQALAQDNVRTMLEELKQQYDFIILDSCPVLPVADSLLLGQNVDTVLMTVMREVSRSPAVHAAHQRLESLGIKTLGAVVIGAKNELGPLGYKYAYQGRPK